MNTGRQNRLIEKTQKNGKNMRAQGPDSCCAQETILQRLQAAPVKRKRLGLELALNMSISIVLLFGTD